MLFCRFVSCPRMEMMVRLPRSGWNLGQRVWVSISEFCKDLLTHTSMVLPEGLLFCSLVGHLGCSGCHSLLYISVAINIRPLKLET